MTTAILIAAAALWLASLAAFARETRHAVDRNLPADLAALAAWGEAVTTSAAGGRSR